MNSWFERYLALFIACLHLRIFILFKVDIKFCSKMTSMVRIRFYISLYLRGKRTQREHEVISKCSWFAFPHSAFISCWWRSWRESKCLKLVTTSLWRRSLLGVFLYTTLLPQNCLIESSTGWFKWTVMKW